jgi:TPR repeat protein
MAFRSIAEQGYAPAQYELAMLYHYGYGVSKDYKAAIRWYRKAAMQGLAQSQNNLGWIYANGHVVGVATDYKEAVRWFRKAADQGHFYAQYNLGKMYKQGTGILQDDIMAYVWYHVAGANGHGLGGEKRDFIVKKLDKVSLVKARRLSRLCLKKPASCPNSSYD